jgi:hypothetical protein
MHRRVRTWTLVEATRLIRTAYAFFIPFWILQIDSSAFKDRHLEFSHVAPSLRCKYGDLSRKLGLSLRFWLGRTWETARTEESLGKWGGCSGTSALFRWIAPSPSAFSLKIRVLSLFRLSWSRIWVFGVVVSDIQKRGSHSEWGLCCKLVALSSELW